MSTLLKILSLMVIVGCGQQEAPVHNVRQDGELAPYYQSFIGIANSYGKHVAEPIGIKFGPLELPVAGVCETDENGYKTVVIDPTYWTTASAASKELLMFHELGHCLLDLEHDDHYKGGIPESIMNSQLIDRVTYQKNRLYYLDELFSH